MGETARGRRGEGAKGRKARGRASIGGARLPKGRTGFADRLYSSAKGRSLHPNCAEPYPALDYGSARLLAWPIRVNWYPFIFPGRILRPPGSLAPPISGPAYHPLRPFAGAPIRRFAYFPALDRRDIHPFN